MAKIILDQSQVVTAIGESKAAGMAQHMRVNLAQTGALCGGGYDIIDALPGQRLRPLRNKHPRQVILAQREPATDSAEFITSNRLLDGEAVL